MLSLVILKKLFCESTISLFISCCFNMILFCSLAWSAKVCCSWACISSCDWFILSNRSSKWWILEACTSSSAVDDKGPATEPTRLCRALFANLVSMAGPEDGGSTESTMRSSTKSVLEAMTFLRRTRALTSATGEVSCAPMSGSSFPPKGLSSSLSLRLTEVSTFAPCEASAPTRSSSSYSSSSSSSSEGMIAFPFLPEALGARLGWSCSFT